MTAKIPFGPGDQICWIEGVGLPTHVLNETLLLVSLSTPLAYELLDEVVMGDGTPPEEPI